MRTAWQPRLREAVAGFVTAGRAPTMKPDRIHLLVPAQRWDWEATPTGETPAAQIAFCDTLPATCAAGSDYAASSDRFSDAYASFLDLLVELSPPSLLEAARAALVAPREAPAWTPSPAGWTKTDDGAGMLRWALDWIVATTPSQWIAEHAGGTAAAVELDAEADVRLADAAGVATVPTAAGALLSASGAGWSRIPVYPGSWYHGSVVDLGRDGPFAGGRAPATVVGPAGVLRCRVAELIVAEQVSVTASLQSAADADDVAAAAVVQLGPVAAGPAETFVETSTVTVTTPAGQPCLVGVIYAEP